MTTTNTHPAHPPGRASRPSRGGRAAAALVIAALLSAGLIPAALAQGPAPTPADGPLTVTDNGHWFEYADSGRPYFMAGSGGPEGFLYYSPQRKQAIVDQLIANDVRAIYIHAVRSNGGDGGGDENPFVNPSNPSSGVDPGVLDEWDSYLSQLDEAGIVTWFHLYDDGARPFGACNPNLPTAEKDFVRTIVERFRDYQHLVWLPTEEHIIKACSNDATDVEKAKALAAEIRLHDEVHPVGVHHNNGQTNQYLGNDDIDVFAQQICQQSRFTSVDGIHDAGEFGEDVYVMAECHPWHKDLLAAGQRTTLRQSFWSSVMAGGYVLFYDAWENTDPTPGMLADIGRINAFMDLTRFAETEPADQLAAADTKWVLGNETDDIYIAYSNEAPRAMGVVGVSAGVYDLDWFDPVTGQGVAQTVTHPGGAAIFTVPAGIGGEVALSIQPTGDNPPSTTTTTAPSTTTTTAPTTTTTTTVVPSTTAPTTTTTTTTTTTAPSTTTTTAPTTTTTTTVVPGARLRIDATEDAYLQGGSGINGSQLRVESGSRTRVTYLRFDTAALASASRATLVLTVGDDPGAGRLRVSRGTDTTWTAATLRPGNAPTAIGVLGSVTTTFVSGSSIEIELDPAAIDGGPLNLVVDIDGEGSDDVAFLATESGSGPLLVVDVSAPPTTTTTTPPATTTTAPPATTTTAPPTTTTTTPPGPTQSASYIGLSGAVPNPERGFHEGVRVETATTGATTSEQQMESMFDSGIRLARMYVRLDEYRGSPIPSDVLANLDEVFGRARRSGIKLIPRFSYNFGSAPDATAARIEQHLDQLAPVFDRNRDVIAVLQAGFIGAWGEWHSSTNGLTDAAGRARVAAALLDAVPADRMIQLRYPRHLIDLYPEPLVRAEAWTNTDQARLGHKNDCFLANEHDAGTYIPLGRKAEYQDYLASMTRFTPTGGETCQMTLDRQRTECATALDELDRFNWDYLNVGFFGGTIDAWRDEGCFGEIQRRLGYRYRMRSATMATSVEPGGTLGVELLIRNDGFGKLYNPRPLEIVLVENDTGRRYRLEAVADARGTLPLSGRSTRMDLAVTVPEWIVAGEYSVHVALPDASPSLARDSRYAVRFANAGVWRPAIGANDLNLDVTVG